MTPPPGAARRRAETVTGRPAIRGRLPSVYIGIERNAVPCVLPDAGALLVFDLSFAKLLVLAVLALLIFGPDQLPKLAAQAGKALRDLRRIADLAKADLKEGWSPNSPTLTSTT